MIVYGKLDPISNLWAKICEKRRYLAMGPHTWLEIKDAIKIH